jgi:hypothetical protein
MITNSAIFITPAVDEIFLEDGILHKKKTENSTKVISRESVPIFLTSGFSMDYVPPGPIIQIGGFSLFCFNLHRYLPFNVLH